MHYKEEFTIRVIATEDRRHIHADLIVLSAFTRHRADEDDSLFQMQQTIQSQFSQRAAAPIVSHTAAAIAASQCARTSASKSTMERGDHPVVPHVQLPALRAELYETRQPEEALVVRLRP